MIEKGATRIPANQRGLCRSLLVLMASGIAALSSQAAVVEVSVAEPTQQPADQQPSNSASARVSVHGVVRNQATGEPLARALVQIEGDANTGTLTDSEGRFEIADLPAGPQIFRVVKPGFRDRPFANEEAGLQAEGPAHSVLVETQEPELEFWLAPDCAIRGRIELSTGDTAGGINLVLLKHLVQNGRAVWAQVAATRSHGDGSYRFGGLPDGTYAVVTLPALDSDLFETLIAAGSTAKVARSGFAAVYYPEAHDLAGASPIQVSGGSQAEANFSLTAEPFYPVSASAGAGQDAEGQAIAIVMDAAGHPLPYNAQFDPATHTLQADLPDGSYQLVVRSFTRRGGAEDSLIKDLETGPRLRQGALVGSVGFTVAGHAISGLRVPLGPPQPATVHLRIVHASDGPPPAAATNVRELANLVLDRAEGVPFNGGDGVWSMESGPDWIAITALPGAYWLSGFAGRGGTCFGSLGGNSLNPARDPVIMSLTAAPPPMELTLRDDCGKLALNLPPALASVLPGEEPSYTVYVVPDFDSLQQIPPMTMHPSSGPVLSIDNLTPGSYQVYLFDTPVHLEYRNAAAMAALSNSGQQVTVSAGTTASLVLEMPAH
jgi:hypothetical protein